MTKEELKPCSFCNQKASVLTEREDYRVVCGNCAASTGCFETAKEATDAWNARQVEENLQKELNESIEDNCENMKYHVAERARLISLLKSCCNEFVPLDKRTSPNYPVCYRNRLVIDKDRHCTARGECPIYAELTKFDGAKDIPDGRLVEFPKLKKAMEKIGDGDGKFSFPPMFPKVKEDENET